MINTYELTLEYHDNGKYIIRHFFGISRVAVARYEEYYTLKHNCVKAVWKPYKPLTND